MKKKIWLCLSLVLCSVFWGCGSTKPEQETTEEKMADYVVGVTADNAPYYSCDDQGKPCGIYVELMEELAKQGDFAFRFLETDVAAFKEDPCDVFLGTMEKENGDMTGLVQTAPFYQSKLCLVTRTADKMKKIKELRNTEVSAVAGGGEASFAKYLAVKYEADSLLFADEKTALDDCISGNAKAMVIDFNRYQKIAEENNRVTVLKTSGKYYNFHRFSSVLQTDFFTSLESEVEKLKEDGTLDRIFQNYGIN